jgi:O-antigen ligase/tetratricopeptide (TPR) repeat protein
MDTDNRDTGWRTNMDWLACAAFEGVVLVMVCLSPWAFGAVHPVFEGALDAGVAVLLVLWAARMLLRGKVVLHRCPIMVCLAALFALGALQLLPLSRPSLALVSPGTAALYDRLIPGEPEVLPLGEARERMPGTAGATLSLYPEGTRQDLLRLLAVFVVFAAVRHNVDPIGGLRRLSIVALVNGALLAFFGLIQFFSSPPAVQYWTYRAEGAAPFGPFICRNHFPFYLNMCVGLGLGYLLASGSGHGSSAKEGRRGGRAGAGWANGLTGLLNEPQLLWGITALAVMLSSIFFSLSRGGAMALLGGCGLGLLLGLPGRYAFGRLAAALLVPALAVALLSWFGLGAVKARLATIGNTDDRVPLWTAVLSLARDFPLWGTGLGTFAYVEPINRPIGESAALVYEHAHNEYLEALIEGGVVRLALSLAAIGFVFRQGWRALRRHRGQRAGGLVVGALVAFATIVFHNIVDFGLHVPAIALLATVVCAYLAALGDGVPALPQGHGPATATPSPGPLKLRGIFPIVGAVAVITLAFVLLGGGWRAYQAERFRLGAGRLTLDNNPGKAASHLAGLAAAISLQPENAVLHVSLAEAHLHLFQELTKRAVEHNCLAGCAQAVLASAALWPPGWPWPPPAALALGTLPDGAAGEEARRLTRLHLVPALRHYLAARDLCPLLATPHLRLAAHAEGLEKADNRLAYLRRAQLLRPLDAELWYAAGVEEQRQGHPDMALAAWRRSLACSGQRLGDVLRQPAARVPAQLLAERVLPDDPHLLCEAARVLQAREATGTQAEPLLRKALALLERPRGPLGAADLHLRAQCRRELGQPDAAATDYQAALAQEPRRSSWRYELANLLIGQGRFGEARRELAVFLKENPAHQQAKELLLRVSGAAAEEGERR